MQLCNLINIIKLFQTVFPTSDNGERQPRVPRTRSDESGCKCYPNDIKKLKISNVSCTELCSGYLLAFINQ